MELNRLALRVAGSTRIKRTRPHGMKHIVRVRPQSPFSRIHENCVSDVVLLAKEKRRVECMHRRFAL